MQKLERRRREESLKRVKMRKYVGKRKRYSPDSQKYENWRVGEERSRR